MPFRGFETATIEVGGTVSSLIIIHSVPLMRLGMVNALRVYATLHDSMIHQGSHLSDVEAELTNARRGDIIISDVAAWSGLEKSSCGLRDRVRAAGAAWILVGAADDSAHRLLQLRGVAGVLSPECAVEELETAVSEVAEGKGYFKHEKRLAPTGMAKLSSRQVEILELMTRGLLNKQIAWELGVTEGTVKSHVSAILEKLGCDRRTQAIAAFLQSLGIGHRPPHATLHA
jgi:DNA-binding NarL/FixJ family response regulator